MNLGTAHIIRADARHLPLPDDSVDLVVTSPPYFALRSYQDGGAHYDGQIGDEATPAEFVDSLLEVTAECVRVLKPSGDKYSQRVATRPSSHHQDGLFPDREDLPKDWKRDKALGLTRMPYQNIVDPSTGNYVREKSLIGIPWRYALRCIDDLGLILRAEVIWSKPNGLPESVTDRVRRSHEQWFHFTLSPRYFSAVDEIREAHEQRSSGTPGLYATDARGLGGHNGLNGERRYHSLGKLPGSVWTVPTEPLRPPDHLGVDHFAAFPTEWPRRIIAGWSPAGVCVACGEGRRPVVATERVGVTQRREATTQLRGGGSGGGYALPGADTWHRTDATITGYACACGTWATCKELEEVASSPPTTPAVILDPFGGTGTVALVAKALGRTGISVDMSADYCRLAEWRTNDRDQLAKVLGVAKHDGPTQDESLFDLLDGGAA